MPVPIDFSIFWRFSTTVLMSAQKLRPYFNGFLFSGLLAPRISCCRDMGVDHGCLKIDMAQKFLKGLDVIVVFEQARGEIMAECIYHETH